MIVQSLGNNVFNALRFDDDVWADHSLSHSHVIQAIVLFFGFYCFQFPVVHLVSDYT